MSEAADFSYFYFMDEYLSILSPSREWFHHLKKKLEFSFSTCSLNLFSTPETPPSFPAPYMAHRPRDHSQRTHFEFTNRHGTTDKLEAHFESHGNTLLLMDSVLSWIPGGSEFR